MTIKKDTDIKVNLTPDSVQAIEEIVVISTAHDVPKEMPKEGTMLFMGRHVLIVKRGSMHPISQMGIADSGNVEIVEDAEVTFTPDDIQNHVLANPITEQVALIGFNELIKDKQD